MTTITLTPAQRDLIRQDMEEQYEMLSDEEIEVLATKLNNKVNIPFVSEDKEQRVLVKIVRRFDHFLYDNLPNEVYGFVNDAHDGISAEEAEQLQDILVVRLNNRIDIPYVPEILEKKIFDILVGLCVKAMQKNFSILSLD